MDNKFSENLGSLQEKLLSELESIGYSEYTMQCVRTHVKNIETFMHRNAIEMYSIETGARYINEIQLSSKTRLRHAATIRHLNDCLAGRPFQLKSVKMKDELNEEYNTILTVFLEDCTNQGNSKETICHKEKSFYNLFLQLQAQGCHKVDTITPDCICRAMMAEVNHVRWTDYRSILRFLVKQGYTNSDFSLLIPLYRQKKPVPDVYTKDEILKVEAAVDTSTAIGKRDYAIILLASRLGLRTTDIKKLKFSNIDFELERISFIQSKTGAPNELPLLPILSSAIADWKNNGRPNCDLDLIFTSIRPPYTEMSSSLLNSIAKRYFLEAGIDIKGKRHGLHSLRASLATSMINNGLSYEETRTVLGHTGDQAIKHYASLDIEKLRLCAQSVHKPSGHFLHAIGGKQ